MSRKKNKQQGPPAPTEEPVLEVYQVPKEILDMKETDILTKGMLVKIISDLFRSERERYKRVIDMLSRFSATQRIIQDQIAVLTKRGDSNKRVNQLDDEVEFLTQRVDSIDDAVDHIIAAYNAMEDYAKHNSYVRITREDFNIEDDTPEEESGAVDEESGIIKKVDCSACIFGTQATSAKGYAYDEQYKRCVNKQSRWHNEIVCGPRYCEQFYMRMSSVNSSSSSYCDTAGRVRHYYGGRSVAIVPLRTTDKPIFFGLDLTTGEKEEFQCQKS